MDFTITKREVIASISIIAIMLLIGIILLGKISEAQMDSNEKYNKAIKIDNTDLFQYGMDTNIGNAFIYGTMKTVDPVTFPEIGGKYLTAIKETERYTKHTRIVTTTDSKGRSHSRTEVYWTWDVIDVQKLKAKHIIFNGIKFESSQIQLPNEKHIGTISGGYHIRYQYFGAPIETKGTIFAYLADGSLGKEAAPYYIDMTIDETVDRLQAGSWTVIFIFIWILLTGGVVYGFYYLDNRWLEENIYKKRKKEIKWK